VWMKGEFVHMLAEMCPQFCATCCFFASAHVRICCIAPHRDEFSQFQGVAASLVHFDEALAVKPAGFAV
jgi:hypothetical protein